MMWNWTRFKLSKGQTNSKLFFQAEVFSKKRTNKFDFTTCRLVFVRFLEESEDAKRHFEINWPVSIGIYSGELPTMNETQSSWVQEAKKFPSKKIPTHLWIILTTILCSRSSGCISSICPGSLRFDGSLILHVCMLWVPNKFAIKIKRWFQ